MLGSIKSIAKGLFIFCMLILFSYALAQEDNILPNSSLEKMVNIGATHHTYLCDIHGNKTDYWGFEIWEGNPVRIFDSQQSHSGSFSAYIKGENKEDAAVLAMPDLSDKPLIGPSYRKCVFSAWVKYKNIKGPGVRLMLQFFNKDNRVIKRISGDFLHGSSSWHLVSITTDIPQDAFKIDPIVELIGIGELWIDDLSLCWIN